MSALLCTVVVDAGPETAPAATSLATTTPDPVVGILHVRLLDVGRQDVSGTVLASTELPGVSLVPGRHLSVQLEVDLSGVPGPHSQLSVEAHLDVSGSGETSIGDYRTMEHVGVEISTLGSGSEITVPVRRVS